VAVRVEGLARARRNVHLEDAHLVVFEQDLVILGCSGDGFILRRPPLVEAACVLREHDPGGEGEKVILRRARGIINVCVTPGWCYSPSL
jgi:hypothetical protein